MTISYPLSLPTSKSYTALRFTLQPSIGVSESPYTFSQQVYDFGGERWVLEASFPPMEPDDARDYLAFLASLRGQYGTFMAGDPLMATPRGFATGTPLVMGGSQTGRSLVTDGWTAGVTNILRKGDYIQIAESMYLVLNDADSNGSGQATLDIAPPLRNTAIDNAPIITTSPKQKFRLDSPASWSGSAGRTFDISFSAVEVLP